ncbi:MAG TPA: hypothetical protein VMW67_08150 [Desulfobacteria bacterium]|nr:hypothetical protein [Desulfobacteria bacterium]
MHDLRSLKNVVVEHVEADDEHDEPAEQHFRLHYSMYSTLLFLLKGFDFKVQQDWNYDGAGRTNVPYLR